MDHGNRQDDRPRTDPPDSDDADRMLPPDDDGMIIDLVDEVGDAGECFADPGREAAIREVVAETAERIARELFPAIAEAIIREEIEKLKQDS